MRDKKLQIRNSTAGEHLKSIFGHGELQADSVIRKFQNTAADGKNYQMQFHNLDAIRNWRSRGVHP
jgi:hypothetical protein